MKRQTPDAAGFRPGAVVEATERATIRETREGFSLWRLPSGSEILAETLLDAGRHGLAGFRAAGVDDEGVWLARRAAPKLRETWGGSSACDWRHALALARSLYRALEYAEQHELHLGRIDPDRVYHDEVDSSLGLVGDEWVRGLLGLETSDWASSSGSTRWTAPEQARGRAWDSAGRRYVAGLFLYRLLAGEHPARHRGLRLGLEALIERGPPPFPEAVQPELPPGLQAYCLKLLAPDPGQRPKSAREVAQRLTQFLEGGAPGAFAAANQASEEHLRSERPDQRSAPPPAERARPKGAFRRPVYAWGLASALLLALLSGGMLSVTPNAPAAVPRVRPRAPMSATATNSTQCAGCHVRQSAEWKRSVMAHSVKSPMFQALEMLIEEQVFRSAACPEGAGVMRKAGSSGDCRDPDSGVLLTGSAGEHWCVNCHAPTENLNAQVPRWDAHERGSAGNQALSDLLSRDVLEGISCAFCHQVEGPAPDSFSARPGTYTGNGFWTSPGSGVRFSSRPEEELGVFGIANSGYSLDPTLMLPGASKTPAVQTGTHTRLAASVREYLSSSQFCGACHDVRLFGTDVIGARAGEHFKRLRNAYSEWERWADGRKREGRPVFSCQDCHMSSYPGRCVADGSDGEPVSGCPPGTRFEAVPPRTYPKGTVAVSSRGESKVTPHYFSGVDVPLSRHFAERLVDETDVDRFGIPLGARQRRDLLLAKSVAMRVGQPSIDATTLRIRLEFENVGAGHRIPAGFSQERELWLHLRVTDKNDRLVYEVGRVDRADEDLRDKLFLRVNTEERIRDAEGRPLGMFGADVADGPDAPRWSPNPKLGGSEFVGKGLVNFQNGFLRCVVCIGTIDAAGRCQPLPGQDRARADRYSDGSYDIDTGRCSSNLSGQEALFETYFPVGALDATRGVLKGPDAIIDTRSLPPEVPVRYDYVLSRVGFEAPFSIEARLLFRAFPPFLLRAFIDYERRRAARGERPSGPLIDEFSLSRLEVVELSRTTVKSE